MREQMINGELAAENVVDRLNAYECALRWKEDDGNYREEEIRSADHFSPAGTEILRRHHDIVNAFVIDDAEGYRYVVTREILDTSGATLGKRSFRKWINVAPIHLYGQWRTTRGYLDFLAWFRSRACHYSAGGKRIDYARESRLEAYGWSAFWSWLRSFPGRCGPEKAIGEWYIAGVFPGYYVDPNFYEPMGYQDLVGYLRDQYPLHPSSYPDATMHLNLFTGRVSFGNPDHALRYADDLKRTMHELGVLCSPVAGIEGHTDRSPGCPGDWQVEEEGASPNSGTPQLEEFKQQGLFFDLSDLERKKRRTADLAKRLGDPNIPSRRKAHIRHTLRVERESERGAARSLEGRSREEIYALALSLARERDRIIEEKKRIEYQLAAVREGLIR